MSEGVELVGVSHTRGGRRLLDEVTLSIKPGELVALIGRNGAGKTTLLRTLLGLVEPESGTVRVGGRRTGSLSGAQRAATFGWLPQTWKVEEPITLLDFVGCARYRFQEPRAMTLQAARKALGAVGLEAFEERVMPTLSGGETQRATLASLVAQEAGFWLLDEPANHLDPAQQFAVYGFIGEQWRAGRGMVCVTHDIGLLSSMAAGGGGRELRVVGMESGRIAFQHGYEDPALPEAIADLFKVKVEVLRSGDVPRFVTSMAVGSAS